MRYSLVNTLSIHQELSHCHTDTLQIINVNITVKLSFNSKVTGK